MNSPANDTANLLAAESSLSLTLGANLYVSYMEDGTALAVCVYDTGGFDPVDALDKSGFDRPTIQVTVRGAKGAYPTAYAKAKAIADFLDNKTETTEGGTRYLSFRRIGDINGLGTNESFQPLLTLNYEISRT